MEEAMKPQRIPETDSIEELSNFWDSHDLTDFEDQLEEVRKPVFVRKQTTIAIPLTHKEAESLKQLAETEGVEAAALVREWFRKMLQVSLSTKRSNNLSQRPAQKTRRG